MSVAEVARIRIKLRGLLIYTNVQRNLVRLSLTQGKLPQRPLLSSH